MRSSIRSVVFAVCYSLSSESKFVIGKVFILCFICRYFDYFNDINIELII